MNRRGLTALLRSLWMGMLVLTALAPAWAHKPSDSYLTITVDGGRVTGRWDIALRDLDFALGLDVDGDGELTWREVRTHHAEIPAYAGARLGVASEGQACRVDIGAQMIDDHSDGAYSVLPLAFACARAPTALTITYRLFADVDPQHRGLLALRTDGHTRTAVLDPQAAAPTFELRQAGRWTQFLDYGREGVWHIWIGFDHILFLLSLLLPAVLVWRGTLGAGGGRWQPDETFRASFLDVLRIVTAFTLAHSITLTLAALDRVTLPSRLVESAIAASVVLAALNNVRPLVTSRRWMVAFGFGLIHGFGFASVLRDLGLPTDALALALVGFNLGVEVGQLAIVAVFLPLAHAARRTVFYRRFVMTGGSLAVAALAAVWLAERLFQVELLGF